MKDLGEFSGTYFRTHIYIYEHAENDQDSEMASADLEQLFSFSRSIEVSETRKGNNISHFVLQYDVTPPKFNKCRMKIASDYVRKNLRTDINEKTLCSNITTLKETFNDGREKMPVLFERVIYHIIAHESHFKWEIYNNNS